MADAVLSARANASPGGRMERNIEACKRRFSRGRFLTPAASARAFVLGLRPSRLVITGYEYLTRSDAIPKPISPMDIIAIVGLEREASNVSRGGRGVIPTPVAKMFGAAGAVIDPILSET